MKVAIEHSLSQSKAYHEKSAEVIVPGDRKRTGKDWIVGGVATRWKPDVELGTDNFILRTTCERYLRSREGEQ